MGNLLKLLLYLIDFGDINDCNVLLAIEPLQLEAFIDGATADEVDSLLDEG
jgi:hypothetical protein